MPKNKNPLELNRGEVKFGSTLSKLMASRGLSTGRQEIAAAVGVSQSMLSQYTKSTAYPTFQTLLRLSDALNCSLDFLVFGTSTMPTEVDQTVAVQYMHAALANAQRDVSKQNALISRLTGRLGDQLRSTADQIIRKAEKLSEAPDILNTGLLEETETMILESFSRETKVLLITPDEDILGPADRNPTPGRYLEIVARNLKLGRSHRVMYPYSLADRYDFAQIQSSYVSLFQRLGVASEQITSRFEFRATGFPVIAGLALYRIDVDALSKQYPYLFERIHEWLDDSWLGLAIPPSPAADDLLMDRAHVSQARISYEEFWKNRAFPGPRRNTRSRNN